MEQQSRLGCSSSGHCNQLLRILDAQLPGHAVCWRSAAVAVRLTAAPFDSNSRTDWALLRWARSDLHMNSLSGTIPSTLGSLTSLTVLCV